MPVEARAADPTLGIAAYLKSVEVIEEATEDRVFRPELPDEEVSFMPRACVVVRSAGGGLMFGQGNLQVADSRLDVTCFGSTRLEADNVARDVARALKNMRGRNLHEVKLYWARIIANPISAIDLETNWPYSIVTTQVMHSLNLIP